MEEDAPVMDFIVSLAHFCEIHGPTSILCTQLVNTSCHACSRPSSSGSTSREHSPPQTAVNLLLEEHKNSQHRSNSEPISRAPSFSRRPHDSMQASQRAALLKQHIQTHQQSHRRKASTSSVTSTAVETPPLSPPLAGPSSNTYFGSLDREGASRSRNTPFNTTASDTCANCSLSLPKDVSEQIPSGAPGSPRKDGKGKNGSPVLRTRDVTFACPSSSSNSSESDTEDRSRERSRPLSRSSRHSRTNSNAHTNTTHPLLALPTRPHPRTFTSSSASTTSSSAHTHGLTYLSTRHPPSPTLYSLLRRSCIRTLSCEQLPHTTSGPLYFSDRTAGSTLAYVFRLPDPRALGRGRKRSYALILLGREEKRMMAVMAGVLRVFENLASWLVGLAEKAGAADVEHEVEGAAPSSSSSATVAATISSSSTSIGWEERVSKGFLERGGRGVEVKARGLADLCGREDVFVELHRQFVWLLKELGMGIGREGWDDDPDEENDGDLAAAESEHEHHHKHSRTAHGRAGEILGAGLGEGLRREVVA